MTLAPKNTQFVLQQLYVNLLLFYLLFGHYFDGELLFRGFVSAIPDQTKGSLTQNLAELVTSVNVFHELKLFVVVNV